MGAYQLGPDDDDEESHCRGPSSEVHDGPQKECECPPPGPGPNDDDNEDDDDNGE